MTSRKLILTLAVAVFALGAVAANAGEDKMVIALKTDDFELVETDISDLAVGDAETIYTQSGKTVDLLRTEDGVEIYVDGELIDTELAGMDGTHEGHKIVHKHIEIICDEDEACEEEVDIEALHEEAMHGAGQHEKIIIIEKTAETN